MMLYLVLVIFLSRSVNCKPTATIPTTASPAPTTTTKLVNKDAISQTTTSSPPTTRLVQPAPTTKKVLRTCPAMSEPIHCPNVLLSECWDDQDCKDDLKCCNNSADCSNHCVSAITQEPLTSAPTTKMLIKVLGKCPAMSEPENCPDGLLNECWDDKDCKDGLKCCNNSADCSNHCVRAITQKPFISTPTTKKKSIDVPGVCPVFPIPDECPIPDPQCTADQDCQHLGTSLKCCSDGCDMLCVTAIIPTTAAPTPATTKLVQTSTTKLEQSKPTNSSKAYVKYLQDVLPLLAKPGKCPNVIVCGCGDELANECSLDIDCPGNQKCCPSCNAYCVDPQLR